MSTPQIIALSITGACLIVIGLVIAMTEASSRMDRDINRIRLERLTVDALTNKDPHWDKVCDLGDLTEHWPTTGLPAEWPTCLDVHEVPALDLVRLALLTPDSELLPAEEA